MSKQAPPAHTTRAVGPCPTLIQSSRMPQHWKFTQHHRTTRLPPQKVKYFMLCTVVFYTTPSKDNLSLLDVVWKSTASMKMHIPCLCKLQTKIEVFYVMHSSFLHNPKQRQSVFDETICPYENSLSIKEKNDKNSYLICLNNRCKISCDSPR